VPKQKHRLAREDWLAAARTEFVARGIHEVKIDRLAKQLKVTRGSFYWHFDALKDLHEALLEDWTTTNRAKMQSLSRKWEKKTPALIDLGVTWIAHGPEFPAFNSAIRDWGRRDAHVGDIVREIDKDWLKLIQPVFERRGSSPSEAYVRARVIYYHRVGYHALPPDESAEELCALEADYSRVFLGRKLTAKEQQQVDQALAEQGFDP